MPKRSKGHLAPRAKEWGEAESSDPQFRENENSARQWWYGPEGETWEEDWYDWMKSASAPDFYDYRDSHSPEDEEYDWLNDPEKEIRSPYYCDCSECEGIF